MLLPCLYVSPSLIKMSQYFDAQTLSDSFFRVVGPTHNSGGRLTGKITSAVPFGGSLQVLWYD